jgi:hypothetical protein
MTCTSSARVEDETMDDNRASWQAAVEPSGTMRLTMFASGRVRRRRPTRLFWG